MSLHLEGNTPRHQDILGGHPAGRQLCRKGPRGPSEQVELNSTMPLQLRLMVFWAVLGKVLPAGQEKWGSPSTQHW